MKKIISSGIMSALLAFFTLTSSASAITAEAVLSEVQNRYDKTNDMEARFLQEYIGKIMMKQAQKGEGKVYFKKKGMMRWDYRVPNQKFISNGQVVWYYQPEENQVLIYDLTNLVKEKTPLAFLAGEGNLSRDFTVVGFNEADSPKEESHVLELTPREPNPALSKLVVNIDKKTFFVIQVDVIDALGNVTRTRFMDIKTNLGLQNSFFSFTIPPGAEVLKMQESPTQAPPMQTPPVPQSPAKGSPGGK
jgi:outer membrane lipoprotein carrier protein